jgi:hypothetical protein
MHTRLTHFSESLAQVLSCHSLGGALHRVFARQSVWVCSCGYTVSNQDAVLSGDDWCSQGFHVHCPRCGRVIAQFVDPKRVGH